ncbi:uncharacterized protein BYT42DRAFT_560471 [Radiomyces spectabilis]|uniref:uncharacterized protein n=1 Tax=Radiomyces spectabilis TaxID=64574 RepID=UPI00221EFBB6|nr:uncharacterized protein BYT42DRAFT_560471 [Radiomyces spectabilis]KAI8388551.1 hypothetical protein BYT42DRAFT_560471 [Radiomyces spectabilis]
MLVYSHPVTVAVASIFAQPYVPMSFAASFLLLTAYFALVVKSGMAESEKQVSWLLTLASSLVCTLMGLPNFYYFWRSGWDLLLFDHDSVAQTALVCFFIVYLVLDLSLGSVFYRRRITILTGWVHHTAYIVILLWFLHRRISSFFAMASILELPTLILAIGSLKKKWRSDLLFAASFFLLRLVLHICMIFMLRRYRRVDTLWMIAVAVLPLHLFWFYCIVNLHARKLRFTKDRCITTCNESRNRFPVLAA